MADWSIVLSAGIWNEDILSVYGPFPTKKAALEFRRNELFAHPRWPGLKKNNARLTVMKMEI